MRKIGIPMILALLLSGAWSCQKEEYTLPADFRLAFAIDQKPVLGGSLTIETVQIRLSAIEIQGYRKTGDNVFMTRSFRKGKTFRIRAGSENEPVEFDIPRGVYNPLFFSLIFQPDDEEDDILEDIEEWKRDVREGRKKLKELEEDLGDIIEDYLDDVEPSIIVHGTYTRDGSTRRLIILANDPLTFRLVTTSSSGEWEVILDKDHKHTGQLTFDPSYWFSVITPEILDEAFLGREDGEAYIFLSKHINSQIYHTLFNRLEESSYIRMMR